MRQRSRKYATCGEPMKNHARAVAVARGSYLKAKRRSQRLSLKYPLIAYSYSETTGKMRFREITHTVKVSAHGGMIPLDTQMTHGETFMLKHSARPEEHPCKVVYVGSDSKTGKALVGFEFTNGQPDFWHIYFPPVVSKPNANGVLSSGESKSGKFYLP